jgi:hypothetical protein
MKGFLTIVSLSLGASLALAGGSAVAQETINADGSSGAAHSGTNPAVDANGPTVVYGDVNVGPGTNVIYPAPGTSGNITATDGNASALGPGSASAAPGTVRRGSSGTDLLGPDGTYSVSDSPPSNVSVGETGAPAPVYDEPVAAAPVDTAAAEPAPEAPGDAAVADTAVSSGADLDGDNIADDLEPALGLDPTNIDTDGDGVADGDELNIYGTDPLNWDSDGDGVSDGEELYNTRTDPLVWNDFSNEVASGNETAAATELTAEEAAPGTAGVDSDGDRLADADEIAIGTDPNNPDTDGDGYYDGDEVALGTDPFDPGSFPAT